MYRRQLGSCFRSNWWIFPTADPHFLCSVPGREPRGTGSTGASFSSADASRWFDFMPARCVYCIPGVFSLALKASALSCRWDFFGQWQTLIATHVSASQVWTPATHISAWRVGLPGKPEGGGVHHRTPLTSSISFASLLPFTLSIEGARPPQTQTYCFCFNMEMVFRPVGLCSQANWVLAKSYKSQCVA